TIFSCWVSVLDNSEGLDGLLAFAGCLPFVAAVSFRVAAIIGLRDATAVGGVVEESKPPLFLLALALGLGAASPEA
nr:hypothetical protein [Tanacetum cinerariifolium]